MHPGAEPHEIAAIAHMLDLSGEKGGVTSHSLADPLHRLYLTITARVHGYTAERYPQLFRALTGSAPHRRSGAESDIIGGFNDGQFVNFVAARPNGLTGSQATLTRMKAVARITLFLSVENRVNGVTTVVASGAKMLFYTQTVTIDTDDGRALPLPSAGKTSSLLSWVVDYVDGTSEEGLETSQWAENAAQDPTATAPIQNPNRHTGDMNSIVIGLARGVNDPEKNADVDYWFWQSEFVNTTLLVPLSGSMLFKFPIKPLNAQNPTLEFRLTRKEGGMSTVEDTAPYMLGFTIDPDNPHQLNFTLMPTPTTAGNAINFGQSLWVSDTKTYFSCKVSVELNGPGRVWGWSSIVSADVSDADPTDGVAYIKPLVYVWHCLVAGTQVTMADGSTKAIESMVSGDLVQSGTLQNGTPQARAVLATLAQSHRGTVYTVTLNSGQTITGSGTHPVITEQGPVQISELAVGQGVLTNGSGFVPVRFITTKQQAGDGLFNLWLDSEPRGSTVFYAGGIMVGDYQMQVAMLNATQTNPEQIRAKLPAALHRDFDSYLEDTVAHAKR